MVIRFRVATTQATVVNDLGLFRLHLVPSGIFTRPRRTSSARARWSTPTPLRDGYAGCALDFGQRWLDRTHGRPIIRCWTAWRSARHGHRHHRAHRPHLQRQGRAGAAPGRSAQPRMMRQRWSRFPQECPAGALRRSVSASRRFTSSAWPGRPLGQRIGRAAHGASGGSRARTCRWRGSWGHGDLTGASTLTSPPPTRPQPPMPARPVGQQDQPRRRRSAIYLRRRGPFPVEPRDAVGEAARAGMNMAPPPGPVAGWFDGVAIDYAAWPNGMTDLVVTKLDVLDTLAEPEDLHRLPAGRRNPDPRPTSLLRWSPRSTSWLTAAHHRLLPLGGAAVAAQLPAPYGGALACPSPVSVARRRGDV